MRDKFTAAVKNFQIAPVLFQQHENTPCGVLAFESPSSWTSLNMFFPLYIPYSNTNAAPSCCCLPESGVSQEKKETTRLLSNTLSFLLLAYFFVSPLPR